MTGAAILRGRCDAHGLDPAWQARCDDRITIPMRPGAESLNVAVAYHLTRTTTAVRPR